MRQEGDGGNHTSLRKLISANTIYLLTVSIINEQMTLFPPSLQGQESYLHYSQVTPNQKNEKITANLALQRFPHLNQTL